MSTANAVVRALLGGLCGAGMAPAAAASSGAPRAASVSSLLPRIGAAGAGFGVQALRLKADTRSPAPPGTPAQEAYQHGFPPLDDDPSAASQAFRPHPSKPAPPMAPKDRVYTDFLRDGMPKVGQDSVVTELDADNRPVRDVGPDRDKLGGHETVFYKQTIDSAMHTGDLPPQTDEEIKRMDARNPSGVDADALRPEATPGFNNTHATLGERAVQRTKQVLSGAWETLKHGVNNPSQPQMREELKKTDPMGKDHL